MKYLIRLLVLAVICFVSYGYFYKNQGNEEGDKWVGIGIMIMALVLMPVFIYHRYRTKNAKDYMLQNANRHS
jgi:uncharacterized membrane protein YukC